jgi:uncharacterized protein (DUF433 family)
MLAEKRWQMSELLARITVDPQRMHGRPCIRDLRITVADVLGLLSAGQSRESILQDYPYLEEADIDAVLAYAARQLDHPIIAAK